MAKDLEGLEVEDQDAVQRTVGDIAFAKCLHQGDAVDVLFRPDHADRVTGELIEYIDLRAVRDIQPVGAGIDGDIVVATPAWDVEGFAEMVGGGGLGQGGGAGQGEGQEEMDCFSHVVQGRS